MKSFLLLFVLFSTHAFAQAPVRPGNTANSMISNKNAMAVFQKCNECHLPGDEATDFTQFPIGGSADSHTQWIANIAASLDLDHRENGLPMPPEYGKWTSDQIEQARKTIRDWICRLAPDAKGKPTISQAPAGVCETAAPKIH